MGFFFLWFLSVDVDGEECYGAFAHSEHNRGYTDYVGSAEERNKRGISRIYAARVGHSNSHKVEYEEELSLDWYEKKN